MNAFSFLSPALSTYYILGSYMHQRYCADTPPPDTHSTYRENIFKNLMQNTFYETHNMPGFHYFLHQNKLAFEFHFPRSPGNKLILEHIAHLAEMLLTRYNYVFNHIQNLYTDLSYLHCCKATPIQPFKQLFRKAAVYLHWTGTVHLGLHGTRYQQQQKIQSY